MRMEFGYNETYNLVKLNLYFERDVINRLFEAAINEIPGMEIFDYDQSKKGNVSWFGAHGPFDLTAIYQAVGGTRVEISLPFHSRDPEDHRLNASAYLDKLHDNVDIMYETQEEPAPEWMWPEFIAPLRIVLEKVAS